MSYRDEDEFYDRRVRGDANRFGDWLKSRPAESWLFFAVGLFIGGLFF